MITYKKYIFKKRNKFKNKFLGYIDRDLFHESYINLMSDTLNNILETYIFGSRVSCYKTDIFNDTIVIEAYCNSWNACTIVYHIDSTTLDREYVVIKFTNKLTKDVNYEYFKYNRVKDAVSIALASDMLFFTGLNINNMDNIQYIDEFFTRDRVGFGFDCSTDSNQVYKLIYQNEKYINSLVIAPDDSVIVYSLKHEFDMHLQHKNVLDSLLKYFIESEYHNKYIVQPGDTIEKISHKLGISDIVLLNLNQNIRFTDEDLIPGTIINTTIPGR